MSWDTIATVVISFLGGGTITALIQNRYENKKLVFLYKKELVASWRKMIANLQHELSDGCIVLNDSIRTIKKQEHFSSLKQHLSDAFLRKLERKKIPHIMAGPEFSGAEYFLNDLTDEISRIEKEWKLI